MRPALIYNPLHNPFVNRFNDPVTRRRDDMQANAYMVWLRERDQNGGIESNSHALHFGKTNAHVSDETNRGGRLLGVFALFLILVFTLAIVLKLI